MQTELENPTARTLTERIADAPPQELVALLLEGARGFTAKAMVAIQQRDLPAKARLVGRVSAIIEQLLVMLNFEEGGEVVSNLSRIYEWCRGPSPAHLHPDGVHAGKLAAGMMPAASAGPSPAAGGWTSW